MTNEELIQKATEDYPPGTKFISCTGNKLTVEECTPIIIHTNDVCVKTDNGSPGYFDGPSAVIYYRGEWAKIIKKGISPTIIYEIY